MLSPLSLLCALFLAPTFLQAMAAPRLAPPRLPANYFDIRIKKFQSQYPLIVFGLNTTFKPASDPTKESPVSIGIKIGANDYRGYLIGNLTFNEHVPKGMVYTDLQTGTDIDPASSYAEYVLNVVSYLRKKQGLGLSFETNDNWVAFLEKHGLTEQRLGLPSFAEFVAGVKPDGGRAFR
ncbi:hypothetical protein EV368DRAFT_65807 [Lentinula lateritia]|uniref:Uncharacterized protein n=1 Tax=Lentinula aff. lateritia TaxID=2804960 RepID=A0ACC1U3P9_9AGAR|nr:hypothetical protein F5876DRAFT_64796 [Lentinula aff. lateritia]KAJ3851373.1 hypothetical protein EV368DRAFT_65807 [Lentinula lateritia]